MTSTCISMLFTYINNYFYFFLLQISKILDRSDDCKHKNKLEWSLNMSSVDRDEVQPGFTWSEPKLSLALG